MTNTRFPAEWEPHRATWIAWPHEASDFPEKLDAVRWVYAEIVRLLGTSELVEILVHDEDVRADAIRRLALQGVPKEQYRLHLQPTNRSWLRDSAPTATLNDNGVVSWCAWQFNAWAKYSNFELDHEVPGLISKISQRELSRAERPDNSQPLVLEGGSIDTDGQGTLLTTEECLLSNIQERNPGLSREGYEAAFEKYLGIKKVIWLDRGVEGDDTHGHVDDIARFVGPQTIVLAYEDDPTREYHAASVENFKRLKASSDANGRPLRVIKLPMPEPIYFDGGILPASYANFYIGNSVVVVPTFNSILDRTALNILAELFPTRRVIGIHAVDLVLGYGTLHCLTQQEPG